MSSRRRFLRGLAGASMALPFLPSVMRAQPTAPIKRFIFLFTANGQRPRNWYPTAPTSWNTVSASEHVREAALDGSTPFSRVLHEDFNSLHSKMLVLRGLDHVFFNGGGHVRESPLSATRPGDGEDLRGVTIDQLMANSPAVYSSPPPVRSIHMICKPQHMSFTSCSVANVGGALSRVSHEMHPAASYARLFGTYVEEGDPNAERRIQVRQRTLDRVRQQYERLRAHPRLSANDRRRLQAHAEMIHDLEARLGVTGPMCVRPDEPATYDMSDEMNLPAATTANIDLLVSAIKCDRTRVATLMLCGGSDIRHSAYLGGGGPGDHHGLSHSAPYNEEHEDSLAQINGWYGSQVADLLTKLDVEEDENGTYLDNSLIFWGNEDGVNRQDAHYGCAQQVMVAGGAAGWRTGRYIDYREVTGPDSDPVGQRILYGDSSSPSQHGGADYRGRLFNSLLISLMEGMGMDAAEWGGREAGIGDYGPNFNDQYSVPNGKIALPYLT